MNSTNVSNISSDTLSNFVSSWEEYMTSCDPSVMGQMIKSHCAVCAETHPIAGTKLGLMEYLDGHITMVDVELPAMCSTILFDQFKGEEFCYQGNRVFSLNTCPLCKHRHSRAINTPCVLCQNGFMHCTKCFHVRRWELGLEKICAVCLYQDAVGEEVPKWTAKDFVVCPECLGDFDQCFCKYGANHLVSPYPKRMRRMEEHSGRGRSRSASPGRPRYKSPIVKSNTLASPFEQNNIYNGPHQGLNDSQVAFRKMLTAKVRSHRSRYYRNGKTHVKRKMQMHMGPGLPSGIRIVGYVDAQHIQGRAMVEHMFGAFRNKTYHAPDTPFEADAKQADEEKGWFKTISGLPNQVLEAAKKVGDTSESVGKFADWVKGLVSGAMSHLSGVSEFTWNIIKIIAGCLICVLLVKVMGYKWGMVMTTAICAALFAFDVGKFTRIIYELVKTTTKGDPKQMRVEFNREADAVQMPDLVDPNVLAEMEAIEQACMKQFAEEHPTLNPASLGARTNLFGLDSYERSEALKTRQLAEKKATWRDVVANRDIGKYMAHQALNKMSFSGFKPIADSDDSMGASDSDDAMEEHAANPFMYVYSFFCSVLKMPMSLLDPKMLSKFMLMFGAIRCLSSLSAFLFELLPNMAKEWFLRQFPSAADHLLFRNSGWTKLQSEIERLTPLLQKSVTIRLIQDAREVIKQCTEFCKLYIRENFTPKCGTILSQFKVVVETAECTHRAKTGQAPFIVKMVGAPRIGKSQLGRCIAATLSAYEAGVPEPLDNLVYDMPAGKYSCEGHKGEKTAFFDEFGGSGQTTKQEQVEFLMKCGTASPMKPDFAALEDKNKQIQFTHVFLCANEPYVRGVEGFTNYQALDARCDALVYTELNPAYHLFHEMDITNIAACMAKFVANATEEEKMLCAHLRHRYLDPMRPWKTVEYGGWDEGRNATAHTFAPKFSAYERMGSLSAEELMDDLLLGYKAKSQDGKNVTQAGASLSRRLLAKENFVKPVEKPIEVDPEIVDTYDKIMKIGLIGTAISALLGVVGYGVHQAWQSRKENMEEHYGTRDRTKRLLRKTKLVANVEHSSNDEEFLNKLDDSVVMLFREGGGVQGFMLDSEHVCTVRHFFCGDDGKIAEGQRFMLQFSAEGGIANQPNLIDVERIQTFTSKSGNEDLVVFRIQSPLPHRKNLHGLLVEPGVSLMPGAQVFRMDFDGKITGGVYEGTMSSGFYDNPRGVGGKIVNTTGGVYNAWCEKGHCGGVIFAEVRGMLKIVGVHSGGWKGKGVYICMDSVKVKKNIGPPVSMTMHAAMVAGHFPKDMVTASNAVQTPPGNFVPVGKFKRELSINTKSDLKRTSFLDAYPEYPCRVAPTMLFPLKVWDEEMKHGMVDRTPFTCEQMRFAGEVCKMLYCIPSSIPRRRYTIHEALAPLDLKKSVGPVYALGHFKRSDLMYEVEGEWKLQANVAKRVGEILDSLENNTPLPLLIAPDLKSECLKKEKIAAGKVRTFEKLDFAWIVVGRILTGAFCDHLTESQKKVPSAIGIDKFSRDFDHLVRELMAVNPSLDCMSDEDFSAWEALMDFPIFDMCADVVATGFYGYEKHSREWFAIRNYFWSLGTVYCVIFMNVYLKFAGMDSGSSVTAVVNSVGHTGLDAAVFKVLNPAALPIDYKTHVFNKVYGDDGAKNVTAEAHETFNLPAIAKVYADHGIKCTDGGKSAELPMATPIEKITFLKAGIAYNSELKAYVPYITYHTLLDQLSYCRDPTPAGMVQAINSALKAAFFYGRKTDNGMPAGPRFDEVRSEFAKHVKGLEHLLVTWESLMLSYNQGKNNLLAPIEVVESLTGFGGAMEEHGNVTSQTTSYNGTFGDVSSNTDSKATSENSASAAVTGKGNATSENTGRKGATDGWTSRSGGKASYENPEDERMDQPNGQVMPIPVLSSAMIRPTIDGPDMSMNLGDLAGHDTGVVPSDFMTSEAEMLIGDLIMRRSYLFQNTLDYSATAGTLVQQIDMSPFQAIGINAFAATETTFNLSPLEWVAHHFCKYRGSFNFHFHYVGPCGTAMQITFIMRYGKWAHPGTFNDELTGQVIVWNVDENNREIVVKVDPVSVQEWMTPYCRQINNGAGTNLYSNLNSYGTILVYYGSRIAGTLVPYAPGPSLMTWISGNADMQFEQFSPLANMLYTPPAIPPLRAMTEHSGGNVYINNALSHIANTEGQYIDTPFEGAPTSLTSLASKPVRLANLTISTSTPVGIIASYNHPSDTLKGQGLYGTQASTFWRANAHFCVKPVTSSFLSAQLWVVFNPGGDATSNLSLQQQSQLPHSILDLSSGEGAELQVNFQHYVDFFQGTTPTMGVIQIILVTAVQGPIGGTTSIDLVVEVSWSEFETFIPSSIGVIPLLRGIQEETEELDYVMEEHAGSELEMSKVAATSEEAEETVPVSVNKSVPENREDEGLTRHLGNLWKRPVPVADFFIITDNNNIASIGLPALPYAFFLDGSFNCPTSFMGLFLALYAAFRGDTIYDIVVKSVSDPNMRVYVLAGVHLDKDVAMSMVPTARSVTTTGTSIAWSSRYGFTYPGFKASSCSYPITEMLVPGKMRVTLPFLSPYRFVGIPAIPSGDPNHFTDTEASENNAVVVVTSSLANQNCEVEVWMQPGDGAKAGIFTGIPTVYLDALINLGSVYLQYPDTFFQLPTLSRKKVLKS